MKRILVLIFALGLLATACGSDSADTDAGADGADSEALSSEAVDDSDDDSSTDSAEAEAEDAASDEEGEEAADDDTESDGGASADGSAGDAVAAAELDELLANTSAQKSGRFEGTMEVTGAPTSELAGSFSIPFTGAFDEATAASELSMDISSVMEAAMEADSESAGAAAMMAPFLEEPMQVRTIGDRSWVKWGLFAMFGAGDKWLESDSSESAAADMGFDPATPSDAFSSLLDNGYAVERIGEEQLRGMTTTRYQSVIDASSMTAEQRSAFGEDLPDEGTYTIDVWVADDLVQRFQITMTDLPQTGDSDLESMTMTYDLFDHGADVAITEPPAAEVMSEADLGFDISDFGSGG